MLCLHVACIRAHVRVPMYMQAACVDAKYTDIRGHNSLDTAGSLQQTKYPCLCCAIEHMRNVYAHRSSVWQGPGAANSDGRVSLAEFSAGHDCWMAGSWEITRNVVLSYVC